MLAVGGFVLVVTACGRAERPSVDAAAQASPRPPVTEAAAPSTTPATWAKDATTAPAPLAPAMQPTPVDAEAALDDAIAYVDQALADIDSALADTEDSR